MGLFKPNIEKLKRKKNIKKLVNALLYEKDGKIRQGAANVLEELGWKPEEKYQHAVFLIVQKKFSDLSSLGLESASTLLELRKGYEEDKEIQDKIYKALFDICRVDSKVGVRTFLQLKINYSGDIEINEIIDRVIIDLCQSNIQPLIESLKDDNKDIRFEAARALGNIKDITAVEALIVALKDKTEEVQEAAVIALGQIKDKRAVEPLTVALKNDYANVRWAAAEALVKLKYTKVINFFIEALNDPKLEKPAALTLCKICDPETVDNLIKLLKNPDLEIKTAAVIALGNIGDPRAIKPLKLCLEQNDCPFIETKKILAKFGDRDSIKYFLMVLSNIKIKDEEAPEEERKKYYHKDIGKFIVSRGKKAILGHLENKEKEVSKNIERFLVSIGKNVVEPLSKILKASKNRRNSYDIMERFWAAHILGEIGDMQAKEALEYVLNDKVKLVREKVQESLEKLKEK